MVLRQSQLRGVVSEAVAHPLYWMYMLWVKLPVALLVVIATAKVSPRGQWRPIRGQKWLKTEDGRYYCNEGKSAET